MEIYSCLGLFASATLAATILPFSSEALLYAMMKSDNFSMFALWMFATSGNVIGATINWGTGRYLYHFKDHKRFPFNENDISKATSLYSKYGVWTLLLAWVPIIGDPLTLIAGMFRTGPLIFLTLVTIGKGGRYALILMIP